MSADGAAAPARRIPYSEAAEQSLLGCVLLDNAAYAAAAEVVQAGDFYSGEHGLVWAHLAAIVQAGKVADPITVYQALQARGGAAAEVPLTYLNELAVSVPTAVANVRAYAEVVRRCAVCRALMRVGAELGEAAMAASASQEAVAQAIDGAMGELLKLQQGGQNEEPRLVADLLLPWMDELQARYEGKVDAVPTGLRDVDRLLAGGMRRGELIVVAARPSMGKSALMLTIARNVAEMGPVLACSMEDSDHMLVSRQVAAAGRVNLADIRLPKRRDTYPWDRVIDGVERLRPLRMYVDDRPGLTLREVRTKAAQVRRREGELLLVIVDYLQLMEGHGETRAYELAGIARGLKRMAKEMRCAVMLLSQLNREADKVSGPPRLDHLAESDAVEQAADVIGLLWREARRNPKEGNKHTAQVEFAKHKNGPTDTVALWFDGATQRFEDAMAAEDADGA